MNAYVVDTPDPSKFKKPHGFATFIPERIGRFKTHSTLGLVKASITQNSRYGRLPDAWVYRFDIEADEWVEIYRVQHGDDRSTHPLYTDTPRLTRARQPIQPIKESVIDKTLASIAESAARHQETS